MKKMLYGFGRLFFWRARARPLLTANVQNILIIKLCCIGDILFSTPLLRALNKHFPRARITYMVSPWCKDLIAHHPGVAGVIEYDPYVRVGPGRKAARALAAAQAIRAGRFDTAVVLHRSAGAALLPALAGVPVRIGFDWEGQGFAHTHTVPYRTDAHEVDRYLDCLHPLGLGPDGVGMELNVPAEAEDFAEQFFERRGVRSGSHPLIAVFPGGGVNPGTVMVSKRWSIAGYREVCRDLVRRYGARLLFVGAKEDAAVSDAVLDQDIYDPAALRAEGQTTLLQTAALLKRCDLFIGNDSGPLHIAAAVGTPTVSIFGPTDPRLLAPRGEGHRSVRKSLACSPCYTPVSVREGDPAVCRLGTLVCMHEVQARDVLRAADDILGGKGFRIR